MAKQPQLLFLELNELNFEFVAEYVKMGRLPHFARLLDRHGYTETSSEQSYEELEPWIQWVTAHTGMPLKEHGIFRLGDIVKSDLPQIWERLAMRGLTVGAVSPMNAKCRSEEFAFFIPDPWTKTQVIGSPLVRLMFEGVVQAVNDNAKSKLALRSILGLMAGAAFTARLRNYGTYLRYVLGAKTRPWNKAIFLDQLLADLFVGHVRTHKPNFATLFLNAAAHIQHHYMFSSAVYGGEMRNPNWYVGDGIDPLLDVYQAYDRILGDVIAAFPEARIMIATGLHQDPHPTVTYYWRLRDHATFLRKIGVPFAAVEPRMSRDFLVTCTDEIEAVKAEARLLAAVDGDGEALFEVDNRGRDLFVMLTYPKNIDASTQYLLGNEAFSDLSADVAFVAIKNGRHNGIGYFADIGQKLSPTADRFELKQVPQRIFEAFELAD